MRGSTEGYIGSYIIYHTGTDLLRLGHDWSVTTREELSKDADARQPRLTRGRGERERAREKGLSRTQDTDESIQQGAHHAT